MCPTVSQKGRCKSLDLPKKTRKPRLTTTGIENNVSKLFTDVSDKDRATLPFHK